MMQGRGPQSPIVHNFRVVSVQERSQAKSRDSSQKMRLKEMAPTYYEARHGQGHDQPAASQVQTASPSLSEIEVIYKGAEPENYNLNTKYIERYPMDFNDEDIAREARRWISTISSLQFVYYLTTTAQFRRLY